MDRLEHRPQAETSESTPASVEHWRLSKLEVLWEV